MHICIYVDIYVYTCIYMYAYTCTNMYIYIYAVVAIQVEFVCKHIFKYSASAVGRFCHSHI